MMKRRLIVSGALALFSVTGCIVHEHHHHEPVVYEDVVVSEEMPVERVEVIPERPRREVVWHRGHWERRGEHHWVWRRGEWR